MPKHHLKINFEQLLLPFISLFNILRSLLYRIFKKWWTKIRIKKVLLEKFKMKRWLFGQLKIFTKKVLRSIMFQVYSSNTNWKNGFLENFLFFNFLKSTKTLFCQLIGKFSWNSFFRFLSCGWRRKHFICRNPVSKFYFLVKKMKWSIFGQFPHFTVSPLNPILGRCWSNLGPKRSNLPIIRNSLYPVTELKSGIV